MRERRRRDIHLGLIKNVLFPAVASCACAELSLAGKGVGLPAWEFCICYFRAQGPSSAARRPTFATNLFRSCVGVVSQCFPLTMDGSLASTQQPHQLPASVGAITRDSTSSAPPQRVSDHPTEVQPEESSPKPELELSSNEVQTTADILQVLQRLQAQQSVPPTPQTASFTPKPEPQPQPQPQSQPPPVSVLPKEESQPTTAVVPGEPVSEWDALRTSLRESPHDTEGWNKLVRLAEDSGDLEKIKEAYECLLKMYPNTVRNLQSVVKHVLTRLRPVVCSNSLSQSFPRAGPF